MYPNKNIRQERGDERGIYHTNDVKCYVLSGVLLLSSYWLVQAAEISEYHTSSQRVSTMASINVTSSVFDNNSTIPKKYSCDGDDVSPPLCWEGAPENTKSFVLICDDPDAPMGIWVHWVVFDISANKTSFPEDVDPKTLGATEGQNSWGSKKYGYGGPCPPSGIHRYYFKIFALDIEKLNLDKNATKQDVETAMKGHIVAQGELMGTYSR